MFPRLKGGSYEKGGCGCGWVKTSWVAVNGSNRVGVGENEWGRWEWVK